MMETPLRWACSMEIGKHRRVRVEPCHLGLKYFGAGNAHQPLATHELQHAGPRGHTALVEIVQQHKTRGPDLVPMQGGRRRLVL
ncbi:MAG TPA: hypothetical protein VLQ80_01695 [Candidatus Saccharimonadia bacterium]|nr:hypothetical protein [Candidatus Saccharimonadia bacterium]